MLLLRDVVAECCCLLMFVVVAVVGVRCRVLCSCGAVYRLLLLLLVCLLL